MKDALVVPKRVRWFGHALGAFSCLQILFSVGISFSAIVSPV